MNSTNSLLVALIIWSYVASADAIVRQEGATDDNVLSVADKENQESIAELFEKDAGGDDDESLANEIIDVTNPKSADAAHQELFAERFEEGDDSEDSHDESWTNEIVDASVAKKPIVAVEDGERDTELVADEEEATNNHHRGGRMFELLKQVPLQQLIFRFTEFCDSFREDPELCDDTPVRCAEMYVDRFCSLYKVADADRRFITAAKMQFMQERVCPNLDPLCGTFHKSPRQFMLRYFPRRVGYRRFLRHIVADLVHEGLHRDE